MSTRTLYDVAAVLAARTGQRMVDARAHVVDYVRAIGFADAAISTVVSVDIYLALLQARIPGLTPDRTTQRCRFQPFGRECPNTATVVVTLTGLGLRPHTVPTCNTCLPDWNDDVQATAVPIAEPTTRPVTDTLTATPTAAPAGGA